VQEPLSQLKDRLARLTDIRAATAVLEWDQETYMPDGGTESRGDQLSTLEGLAHEYVTSDEIGSLLYALKPGLDEMDYDSDEASIVRVALREHEKLVKVPASLIEEIAKVGALGFQAWGQAREQDDFGIFEPHLSRLVELKKQWASCFDPEENLYDPLLDDYEPGITHEQIGAIFAGLKPRLIALVRAISENRDAVDDSALAGEFEIGAQRAFGERVAAKLGYRFENGRLDESAHPFTTHFSRWDVRITTRYSTSNLMRSLMGTIHETGHALYEQNTSPTLYRTGLGSGASTAVHESQSRLYENIVGRSRPFWAYFYPQLQEAFPHFKQVEEEAFYRAINKSGPSLIRVDADEVTYGLHVILRFELENDLINGRVRVADLPDEWNSRMEAYLGIVPPNDTLGVMQDVHWSRGYFGYFPGYLLGNLLSAQLWERMIADMPDLSAQIEAGQFEAILAWLGEHIHRHGMKFTLPELTERVVGGELDWLPYIQYLERKFGEIYGL
jgi:carboxypeptidase Taq